MQCIVLLLIIIPTIGMSAPPKSIYVVGLESSGTRALSRLIASMVAPKGHKVGWNGAYPFCYNNIHHVSLPYNDVCRETMPIIVNSNGECGSEIEMPRFILNVSNVLHKNDKAIAVIITRVLKSVWKSSNGLHCSSLDTFLKESKASIQVMSDVLNQFPNRTILVSYHSMAYFQKRTMADMNVFLQKHGWRSHTDIDFVWRDRDHHVL